jgi:hypothetical protein
LFGYSVDGGLILSTSELCLEEWRSQKICDLENNLISLDKKIRDHVSSHCGQNYFSKIMLEERAYSEIRDPEILKQESQKVIDDFTKRYNIKRYGMIERHINPTWNAYFQGHPPFKEKKNRKDIPDAWVFEGAKEALNDPEHNFIKNKFCICSDGGLSEALNGLGFVSITLEKLIEFLQEEKMGATNETADLRNIQSPDEGVQKEGELSSLEKLLDKVLNNRAKEIYLRLLGFVKAFEAPSHEILINAVVSKGFERKLTEACATMLSDQSMPYIKDTGSHYIVGDEGICAEAAERIKEEIIGLLE